MGGFSSDVSARSLHSTTGDPAAPATFVIFRIMRVSTRTPSAVATKVNHNSVFSACWKIRRVICVGK
jgi:hypothetical protein